MNTDDFNKVVQERFDKCKEVLGRKGNEYSNNNDRLYNFKIAAKIQGGSPEKALLGMMVKHLVSVIDIINYVDKYNLSVNDDLIDEKLGDTINYIVLLEGLIKERRFEELK